MFIVNIRKKKPITFQIVIALLAIVTLLSISITFAFFSDRSAHNIGFSTVNALDYDYTLGAAINDASETTVTSTDDEVFLVINEKNNEATDLYSKITITAAWKGDTDINDVSFINSATGGTLPVTIDVSNNIATIVLDSNEINANNSLTHKIEVILSDFVENDTLNFKINSDVSAVKDSWAETVGPVNLSLHAKMKYPIKLEVADDSAHRTAYLTGDNFDPENLKLKVTYNDTSIAYIEYFEGEDVYKIDTDANGTYDKKLTNPDEFYLDNINDLAHIALDYTSGGTGTVSWCSDEFTYTYNENDATYTVNWNQTSEYMQYDWFEYHYINKSTVTLVPNDSNDYTKGGTGIDADGKSFTFETGVKDGYDVYILYYATPWSETITATEFNENYALNADYDIIIKNVSDVVYPLATYIESNVTLTCDIPITVGNAIMRSWTYDQYTIPNSDFHAYARYVTSVEFLTEYNLPNGFDTTAGFGPWDVSRDQDGSVIAYGFYDEESGAFDVKIASNVGKTCKVYANTDPGSAFRYFSKMTSFDGTNLDTSKATKLESFLESCVLLEEAKISNWDVSNVENMKQFLAFSTQHLEDGESLSIDLSKWDVSKVRNFDSMFDYVTHLSSIGDTEKWTTASAEIFADMFKDCYILTSVNTSNWITTNVTDMNEMFADCDALTTVDVSKWNVGKVSDFESMFEGCDTLSTLNVANWKPASATTFRYMFNKCITLNNINVKNWTTTSIENTNYMFQNCYALTSIDLTGWDCSNLSSNLSMFERCYSLESLVIPSSMEMLNNGFARRCPVLDEITFLHTANDTLTFSTAAGTYGAFKLTNDLDSQYPSYTASNLLKTKVITNNSTTKDTIYAYLWENDFRSLLFDVTVEEVTGGTVAESTDNLTAWSSFALDLSLTPVADDWYEFKNWTITYTDVDGTAHTETVSSDNLATFTMPYADITITPVWEELKKPVIMAWSYDAVDDFHTYWDSITEVEFMTTYNLPDDFDTTAEYGPWDVSEAQDESVMAYTVENGGTIEIYDYTTGTTVETPTLKVYICANTTRAEKIIANIDSSDIFYRFEALETVTGADNLNMSTAEDMSYMFYGCEKMTTLDDISDWDVSNVENMHYLFAACQAMSAFDVAKWQTTSLTDMGGIFYDCWDLVKLDLSKWDVDQVTTMALAFGTDLASSLTTIGDVSGWQTDCLENMYGIFYDCANLEVVNVSNWNTENVYTLKWAFTNCAKLTELDVSKWNTGKVKNMEQTFSGCDGLNTIDISGWDCSSLETDGNKQMFAYCEGLTNLTIPASMQQLAAQFAYHCEKLTSITFNHTANDPLTIYSAGYYNGPFRAIEDYATGDDYSSTNLLATKVYVNNDTIKSILETHDWATDCRDVTYNTVTLQLNLNGGEVIE